MSHCFQIAQVNSIASDRRIAMLLKHQDPYQSFPFPCLWGSQGGADTSGWDWWMGLAESRCTMLTLCSVVPMLSTGRGSTVLLTPHLLMAAVHAVERISVSTDSAKTISHCSVCGTHSTPASNLSVGNRTWSLSCHCPGFLSLSHCLCSCFQILGKCHPLLTFAL